MPEPVRLVQIGAGSMGRAWLSTIAANPDVELVGLVDLDVELARRAAADLGYPNLTTGTDLAALLLQTRPDGVVNVTVPSAHRLTTETALDSGVAVLCEKPISDTLSGAWSMVQTAGRSGRLLMVSQSRRYSPTVAAFQRLISKIGPLGSVACQFFRAPHFGGFREEMEQPLLVDMAIHHFDLARLLTRADPVTVACTAYNPSWSWYAGDAAAEASFEFSDSSRFHYSGSWCAPGLETSWNGSWRVSGANGTATWDGDNPPTAELADGTDLAADVGDEPKSIAGSLAEFVHRYRTGSQPDTAAARNIISLAMVEGAILSADRQRPVAIADVLATAQEPEPSR